MQKLILVLVLLFLYSCDAGQPQQERDKNRKFQSTGQVKGKVASSPKTDSAKIDSTKNVSKKDTVVTTIVVKEPNKSLYPEAVSQILLRKRAYILAKENKPLEFYSKEFFNIFELESTNQNLINHYDNLIDSFVNTLAESDDLNYDNVFKGNSNVIVKSSKKVSKK